jgi:hypothetical protein
VLAYMFVVKEIEWCCYKYIYKHDFEWHIWNSYPNSS